MAVGLVATEIENSSSTDAGLTVLNVNAGDLTFSQESIPAEQVENYKQLVHKLKLSLGRIIEESINAGEYLSKLNKIVPHSQFKHFCESEFKISFVTAWRYIRVYEYVSTTFTIQHRLEIIPKFNLATLQFLSTQEHDVTPEQLVELAESLPDGKKVTRPMITNLMAELEERNSALIDEHEGFKKLVSDQEKVINDMRSAELLSASKAQSLTVELESKANEIAALSTELSDTKAQLLNAQTGASVAPEVIAMIPAEFDTIEQAKAALELQVASLTSKRDGLQDEVNSKTNELRTLRGAVEDSSRLIASLDSFINDLQMLANKHDIGVINHALSIASPKALSLVQSLLDQVKGMEIALPA